LDIYISNLPANADPQAIRALFEQYGEVSKVSFIAGGMSTKHNRAAFVTMENDSEALAAIRELNGQPYLKKNLNISPARSAGLSSSRRNG
jgi:RNA recognition motif-containing protein